MIVGFMSVKLYAMTEKQYEQSEYLISRWWLSLIIGLICICLGFIVLVNPVSSYYTFAIWMGLAILLSGVMGLVQSFSSKNIIVRRGWQIVSSILDIIIGVLLLSNMFLSAMILPLLLGFWLLYRGGAMLVQAYDMRSYGRRDSGWMIFYSIILIILGVAIIWAPSTFGAETVVLFIAIGFLTYGISIISLAIRLWRVHRYAKTQIGNH